MATYICSSVARVLSESDEQLLLIRWRVLSTILVAWGFGANEEAWIVLIFLSLL